MIAITFCMVVFNLYAVTKAYSLHKVVMEIKLHHQRELTFPAVTICNMNPFRRTAIENSHLLRDPESSFQRQPSTRKQRTKRATGEIPSITVF